MSSGQKNAVYNTASNAAARQNANSQNSYNSANTAYNTELATPGYTAQEKQAMKQGAIGSLAAASNAAANNIRNRAGMTGNAAGGLAAQQNIARTAGQQQSEALGGLESQFADTRIKGMQNAAAGEAGLSGQQGNLASENNKTAGQMATTPGFWQRLALSAADSAGKIGAAAVGKGR